jgi:DNA invertase Pin-like site-specific DNA recombinase
MKTAVAVYTRLSLATAEQTATARQERACRLIAEARGWRVAKVYEDVDLSAFAGGIRRPSVEQMLADIAAHRVGGVLVWKLDRLVRSCPCARDGWRRGSPSAIPARSCPARRRLHNSA